MIPSQSAFIFLTIRYKNDDLEDRIVFRRSLQMFEFKNIITTHMTRIDRR